VAVAPAPVSAPAASNEVRPVLRLSGDRRESDHHELTSSWVAPSTGERLTVSPVPTLSNAGTTSRTSTGAHEKATLGAREPEAVAPLPAANPQRDDLYVHALDLLRRRELPEALRELDAFVRDAPNDPRIARAQFWRVELLFAERQFVRALAAYEQVLLRDGSGDKAADALLRIARCHQRLGARERARAALLRLRTQFPQSAAARQAEQEPELTAQEDT
jgi:tol-pal system protein YbgF